MYWEVLGYIDNHLNFVVGASQFISIKCKIPQLGLSQSKCKLQQQLLPGEKDHALDSLWMFVVSCITPRWLSSLVIYVMWYSRRANNQC